ncbi:MAG: zinc-dependent alcohol dehydrogenase family protein [Promethearchaeota archaeon]
MKAIIIKDRHELELADIDIPKVREDELLVRVKASGVCGTDVHVYEGEVAIAKLPVVPGHEFSGVIEEVGKKIVDIPTGTRVAIEPNLFCGYCHFCRQAKKHFCENWQAVGLTRNGGFSEYVAVPRQAVYPISDAVSFEQGAFFEPVACVLHGIERSGVKPGESVTIMGAGSIGLLYVQILKAMGIKNIISSDIDPKKLEIARKLGATITVNPLHDDVEKIVKDVTGGFGAEVVIDAAGARESLSQSFSLVQDTGTIVVFGVPAESMELPVKMFDIYRRELSIVGSFTNPYTNEQALRMLSTGAINIEDIVTHFISLNEVEATVKKIRDRTESVIKAQITF